MFGSDVLDAAAIGAAAALLGGIVAGIFTLLTTRMSHKADLKKIAYENRLKHCAKCMKLYPYTNTFAKMKWKEIGFCRSVGSSQLLPTTKDKSRCLPFYHCYCVSRVRSA